KKMTRSPTDPEIGRALRAIKRFAKGELDVDIDFIGADRMNRVSQYLTSNQKELIVRGSNVASLLKRYIEGKISADQLSKWGKFVFHGYPTWNQYQGGRLPLPISYESSVEDLLSEVVSELEEI